MAAEAERDYLKSMGNPENKIGWAKQVDKMSDEKVIEVYLATKEYLDAKEEA